MPETHFAYVHANRDDDDAHVELNESVVFLQSVSHEAALDLCDEVVVESAVNEQNEELRNLVPDVVYFDVSAESQAKLVGMCLAVSGGLCRRLRLRNLHVRRNKDAKY